LGNETQRFNLLAACSGPVSANAATSRCKQREDISFLVLEGDLIAVGGRASSPFWGRKQIARVQKWSNGCGIKREERV